MTYLCLRKNFGQVQKGKCKKASVTFGGGPCYCVINCIVEQWN